MTSKLYLVPTPIGNYKDITIRALEVLNDVDFIICEEFKEARRLLSHFKIEKPLVSLNEHNEKEASEEIFQNIKSGKTAAIISDCGTPLFSDPGLPLVQMCIDSNIDIISLPGANSLLPALVASGFDISKFYYAGWLSPKKDLRKKELIKLKAKKELIVIMETPYRLKLILTDVERIFGGDINICLAYNLTLPTEKLYRGTASEILSIAKRENLKGEFVLIINNK
ncbi:16S rRNA (cytidine(1402)-2'-O)-methyltransferase [Melioribacteraceae bacterium 4301-Me]|uniref:16S rRNA (cytidine(1402)-2'-O)-methyltransferase n=1 Tax=Pyranulibacter aquaticus TaxID=3163344 RepID=UPI003599A0B7